MEICFNGSADSKRAAWAALTLENGCKPRLFFGTGRDIPCHLADRWAAQQVLEKLRERVLGNIRLVSDRQDNICDPVDHHPPLSWMWRSRNHPVIQRLDGVANALRCSFPCNRQEVHMLFIGLFIGSSRISGERGGQRHLLTHW